MLAATRVEALQLPSIRLYDVLMFFHSVSQNYLLWFLNWAAQITSSETRTSDYFALDLLWDLSTPHLSPYVVGSVDWRSKTETIWGRKEPERVCREDPQIQDSHISILSWLNWSLKELKMMMVVIIIWTPGDKVTKTFFIACLTWRNQMDRHGDGHTWRCLTPSSRM